MTVSSLTDKVTYQGNGSTTVWTFPFAISSADDIQVFVTDTVGHVGQLPVGSFSVSVNAPVDPNPTSIGGQVTYPLSGSPITVGQTITIARVMVENQPTSIANQSAVYPPIIEQALDRLTMIDQQLSDQINRAVTAPISDPPMAQLPPAVLRANMTAVFDANGNLTASNVVVGTAVSAAMVPVVNAATLAAARSAMGVPPVVSPIFTGDPQAPTPPIADNDTSIATTAFVQNAIAGVGGAFSTGDVKLTHKTTADAGWTMWSDGTIGDAASGASNRAAADCQALFTLYYNSFSDGACPLFNQAGTQVTRASQGTAASAWGAHCKVALPKGVSRSLSVAGASGVGLTPRAPGDVAGSEVVTLTTAQMPAHNHPTATTGPHTHDHTWTVNSGAAPISQNNTGPNNWFASDPSADIPLALDDIVILPADIAITSGSVGGGASHSNITPSCYLNAMIKL